MRALPAAVLLAAITVLGGVTGCSSPANAADLRVGDCLQLGGTADRPEAAKVACGGATSNFKVVATVVGAANREQCPTDVDSSYSMRNTFSDASSTACLDIDWVIGGCMSVDPANTTDPFRVDCTDSSVPHRQRATQILRGVASVDECTSGLGYAYDERQFTVCVEDVT
ncbi:hypothetical protein ACAG26_13565 [Mycobacterium sp. pUA109]|uniref:LppU family putative lipoprotein n=1 Tax=Mycobacterium sp. pUA109 TaxID=3238982 RepID=UPI00351B06C5